jgi:hypothetical protein
MVWFAVICPLLIQIKDLSVGSTTIHAPGKRAARGGMVTKD